MKIIICDDEKDFSQIVKRTLEGKGYEVILDPTGFMLDNLNKDLPDLIILDINLCHRDGGDLCTKLKHEDHTKHIPVLLISAIMDLKPISQFCGADDFLIKPFQISELEQ
jgi:DNA-binding response OmpR family regulator